MMEPQEPRFTAHYSNEAVLESISVEPGLPPLLRVDTRFMDIVGQYGADHHIFIDEGGLLHINTDTACAVYEKLYDMIERPSSVWQAVSG